MRIVTYTYLAIASMYSLRYMYIVEGTLAYISIVFAVVLNFRTDPSRRLLHVYVCVYVFTYVVLNN